VTDATRPRVAVVGTGGTIAFEGTGSFDLVDYGETSRVIPVEELLARVPELSDLAEVVPGNVTVAGSNEVGPPTWLVLRSRILQAIAEDSNLAGVVVTHGTATLEETAYFLHLTLPTRTPVVLVGAQRPIGALGSDVGPNLAAAIRVASSKDGDDAGVTVVLNDEIHCARDVTKSAVSRLNAFRSSALGPLGYVEADGRVMLYRKPTRLHTLSSRFARPGNLESVTELPRVDIAYSYAGSDGFSVSAAVDAGARGIVLAALSPGLLTPGEEEAVHAARAKGLTIVLATRAGAGRVARRTVDRERGLVAGDDLTPQKARVLAMLALRETTDPDAVQELFDTH
jgi:L-asparaginase